MTYFVLIFCLVETPTAWPHPGCLPIGEYRTGAEALFEAENFCALFPDGEECFSALWTKKMRIDEKLAPIGELLDP